MNDSILNMKFDLKELLTQTGGLPQQTDRRSLSITDYDSFQPQVPQAKMLIAMNLVEETEVS